MMLEEIITIENYGTHRYSESKECVLSVVLYLAFSIIFKTVEMEYFVRKECGPTATVACHVWT